MIYLHKRNTGMGRLAQEMRLSIRFKNPNTQTFENARWRMWTIDPMVNWGCGPAAIVTVPESTIVLNNDISGARSKVSAFNNLEIAEIPHPRWALRYEELAQRLKLGRIILGRHEGLSGGAGIDMLPGPPTGQHYDFFVERLSYQRELRIHVWRGVVIASQVKVVPVGCDNFIHSYDNGCTFSRDTAKWGIDAQTLRNAQDLATRAVDAVGLDFGAVDLILTKRGKLYVLEVNSAPGIRCDYIKEAYCAVLEPMRRQRGNARASGA